MATFIQYRKAHRINYELPTTRVLIGDVHLTVQRPSLMSTNLSFTADIGFKAMIGSDWPHDKAGISGNMKVNTPFRLTAGRRLYLPEENIEKSATKWKKAMPLKEFPSSLPVAKFASGEIEVTLNLEDPLPKNVDIASNIVREIRTQIPPEMFDSSRLVCGTYVDPRMLVLRGVNGQALVFVRSCEN